VHRECGAAALLLHAAASLLVGVRFKVGSRGAWHVGEAASGMCACGSPRDLLTARRLCHPRPVNDCGTATPPVGGSHPPRRPS
jgi:hypothetical protein